MAKSHIVVLGAGVIGLQTAVTLLKKGYDVTILAKHFPGDESIEYTSPWTAERAWERAGAQWRTHAPAADKEKCDWDLQSYKQWTAMAEGDPEAAEKAGIRLCKSTFYWSYPTAESAAEPWFAPHVHSYTSISSSSLPPNTVKGITYTSVAINPPAYISHLLSLALSLGAATSRLTLPTTSGLAAALRAAEHHLLHQSLATTPKPIAAFVNCTGLGARALVPDAAVFPVRGQTLLVRGQAPGIFTREDANPAAPSITYVLPRPGRAEVVLGGTKQAGDWTAAPMEKTSKGIVERCRELWPEGLRELEVLAVQVGLRPGREGGPRVEVEVVVDDGDGDGKWVVVHQYGHSGAGFQNSIGSAAKAVRLLEEHLAKLSGADAA